VPATELDGNEVDVEYLLRIMLVGIGATLVSDFWGLLRQGLFGAPRPDYAMVGRWIGHFTRGRFRHDRIAAAPAIRGERAIGWTAHYLIGISFALLAAVIAGPGWLSEPTLPLALFVGIGTVLAPFLVLQPAMGAGFFASRAPNPAIARLHSVLLHASFGFGLYGAALLVAHSPLFSH